MDDTINCQEIYQLDESMLDKVKSVTPRDLRELVARLPRLRLRFREMFTSEFPFLPAQLELFANVLEAAASGLNEAIPMLTTAEVVAAMARLAGGTERIAVSDAQFRDGAATMGAVIGRNRCVLQRFAIAKGMAWTSLEAEACVG